MASFYEPLELVGEGLSAQVVRVINFILGFQEQGHIDWRCLCHQND